MNDLISRQAAIDYCYALINAKNLSNSSDECNYSQKRLDQTEVILHHLEFMPSAQPETHEERTKTHACDYIERQDAIDAINALHEKPNAWLDSAVDAVMTLPPAQPESEERKEESAQNVQNEDLISRKAAIDVAENAFIRGLLATPDLRRLPSAQPEPLSDAYMKSVWTWLLDYQIKVAKLKGRYTPYEVLSWVANDWRKEHE